MSWFNLLAFAIQSYKYSNLNVGFVCTTRTHIHKNTFCKSRTLCPTTENKCWTTTTTTKKICYWTNLTRAMRECVWVRACIRMIWIHSANSLMWNFSIRHMFHSYRCRLPPLLLSFSHSLSSAIGSIFSSLWNCFEYEKKCMKTAKMRFQAKETLRHIRVFTNKSEEKKFGIILCSKDHAEGMERNGKYAHTVYTFHKITLIVLCCSPG